MRGASAAKLNVVWEGTDTDIPLSLQTDVHFCRTTYTARLRNQRPVASRVTSIVSPVIMHRPVTVSKKVPRRGTGDYVLVYVQVISSVFNRGYTGYTAPSASSGAE